MTDSSDSSKSSGDDLFKDLSKDCECAICLEIMENPRSLDCRHSFCKDCLETTVDFNENSEVVLKCPTCRKVTNLGKGQTVGTWTSVELSLKKYLDTIKR